MGKKSSPRHPAKRGAELREEIRNHIREERDMLSKQWMAFKENVKAEDFRREQFMKSRIREHNRVLPQNIKKFIGSLKRAVRKIMRDRGGTAFSIIRDMFLYWDADHSGHISRSELKGVLKSLGIITTEAEEHEIIEFYHADSGSQMIASDKMELNYHDLLADIQKGEPTVIEFVSQQDDDLRNENELHFQEVQSSFTDTPPIVRSFIEVLQDYIATKMRNEGGTPYSVCHDLMKSFDYDYSNGLNSKELQTACIKAMKLNISLEQAAEIVAFYDFRKTGEMTLDKFYPHVSVGTQPLLSFQVKTPRTLSRMRESLAKNPLVHKQFHAAPNKLLEKFKIDVKLFLESKVKAVGGSAKSWINEAFSYWDPKGTKTISRIDHIVGAARRLGVEADEELARVLLKSYDRYGTNEMHYLILVDELTHNDAHFITDATTQIQTLDHNKSATARIPPNAARCILKFKTALEAYVRKSKGNLSPKDILHGTCIRFDAERNGKLSQEQFSQVCRELRVNISEQDDISTLITWFDTNGTGNLDYNAFSRELYGEDILNGKFPMSKLPSLTTINESSTMKISSSSKSLRRNTSDRLELTRQKNLLPIESLATIQARNLANRRKILAEKKKLEQKLHLIEEQRSKVVDEFRVRKGLGKKNTSLFDIEL